MHLWPQWALCGLPFGHEDLIEVGNITQKAQGGKGYMANHHAVQRHCHETKTALDAVGHISDKREEPDAVIVPLSSFEDKPERGTSLVEFNLLT